MKIQIPEPCHEDWNKMSPTEKGRFCGSCKKEVVDFTGMSKHQIQQYFINKTTEATCGRIENRQLIELNSEEKQIRRFTPIPWWIAAATFLFISKLGFSQGETHSDYTDSLNKKRKISTTLFHNNDYQKEIEIRGTILDLSTQEALPFVTVVIKGTKQGCVSDINGNFRLSFAKENRDTVVIEVRFVGYETYTKTVQLNKDLIELDTLNLKAGNKELGGLVVVDYATTGLVSSTEIKDPILDTVSMKEGTDLNQHDSSITVTGKILDENGDTLPFVNIIIVGTQLGAVSDFEGKFELIVPREYQDSLTLKTSFIGYEPISINLIDIKKDTNIEVIQFTEQQVHVLGGAIIYTTTEVKTIGRIRSFFWRLFH